MRNYKLLTFLVSYEYTHYEDDQYGQRSPYEGRMEKTVRVVAKSPQVAEAVINRHYNHDAYNHRNYKCNLVAEDEAPILVLEHHH